MIVEDDSGRPDGFYDRCACGLSGFEQTEMNFVQSDYEISFLRNENLFHKFETINPNNKSNHLMFSN